MGIRFPGGAWLQAGRNKRHARVGGKAQKGASELVNGGETSHEGGERGTSRAVGETQTTVQV